MNTAYSSKNAWFPTSLLQSLLLYEGTKETAQDCHHYGINVQDNNNVCFLKSSFNLSVKQVSMQLLDPCNK